MQTSRKYLLVKMFHNHHDSIKKSLKYRLHSILSPLDLWLWLKHWIRRRKNTKTKTSKVYQQSLPIEMISPRAYGVVCAFFKWGCNTFKIFPYHFDETTCRLREAKKGHLFVYNCHRWAQWSYNIWCYARLIQSLSWSHFNNRIRAIQIVWNFAILLDSLCYLQFQLKRKELQAFGNACLSYIEDKRHQKAEYKKKGIDFISLFMILSGWLLYINPMAHSFMMIESPCTPHFVSSTAFPCERPDEDTENFLRKIPYFLFETYIVGVCLNVWFFNWCLIYLGLAWIIKEMRVLKKHTIEASLKPGPNLYHKVYEKYRELQIIILTLNKCCKIYLEWFPSILLAETAIMLYGTIRFVYLAIHSYLMFPACAVRCIIESMTLLTLAGIVNLRSFRLLEEWRNHRNRADENSKKDKWLTRFHKSCPYLKCTAGSLYTFENSIVLCTISNCIDLTVNMLLLLP